MGLSKTMTLPKPFTENYLNDLMIVRVTLSPQEGTLKLMPIFEVEQQEEGEELVEQRAIEVIR